MSFVFNEVPTLQDLSFPVACINLDISPNNKRLIASGIYKPTVKVFDLKPGVMKYERHLVCEPIKNFFLDADSEKFAILRTDKTIEFHIKGGFHDKIKTCNQPRDVVVNKFAAELYIGGNYNEINRFSLERGRFLKGIQCTGGTKLAFSEINTMLGAVSKKHVSFFDTRVRLPIFEKKHDEELVTIAQDHTGLNYIVGTETGELIEYDLRSNNPLRSFTLEEHVIKSEYSNKNIVASTTKKIHVFDRNENQSTLEIGYTINTFCMAGGAVFVGGESTNIKTFTCEALGSIPDWIYDAKTNM